MSFRSYQHPQFQEQLGSIQDILFDMSSPANGLTMATAKAFLSTEVTPVKDSVKTTAASYILLPSSDKVSDHPLNDGQNDPFVVKEHRLSATAAAFKPAFKPVYKLAHGGNCLMSLDKPNRAYAADPIQEVTAILHKQIAEAEAEAAAKAKAKAEKFFDPGNSSRIMSFGVFSFDNDNTRSMKITAVLPGTDLSEALQQTLKVLAETYTIQGEIDCETTKEAIYLRADHIGDAQEIYRAIRKNILTFVVKYIFSSDYGQVCNPPRQYCFQEGTILVTAPYPSTNVWVKEKFENDLVYVLNSIGKVHAWKLNTFHGAELCQMIAEFTVASDAGKAVEALHDKEADIDPHYPKMKVELYEEIRQLPLGHLRYKSGSSAVSSNAAFADGLRKLALDTPLSTPRYNNKQPYYPAYTSASPPTPAGSMMPIYSPGSPSTPMGRAHVRGVTPSYSGDLRSPFRYNPSPYSNGTYSSGRRNVVLDMSPTQFGSPYSGAYPADRTYPRSSPRGPGLLSPFRDNSFMSPPNIHNSVEPSKILNGEDVRTTVMLRNIPNKISQLELKAYLDVTSFGKYDFFYLRIDFSNNCNVGYAFINYTDPLDIIPFFLARAGRRWDAFKSDKISEISYATIQGRDCLIQKFRNSSVMAEAPHCRPKLFYTVADPKGRLGEEETFPGPDNIAKLKRSCENAEHIGLYAPNAGNQYRDEQRRRRSQYDRGTTMAEVDGQGLPDFRTPEHRRSNYADRTFM